MARVIASAVILLIMVVGGGAATTQIKVSPRVLAASGDAVSVSWSATAVSPHDSIRIIAAGVHDIGFYNLSNTKGWPALTGTARLPLVNMRSNYTFEYLSGPSRTPVATSNAVTFADNNEPTQLHLGLCGAPGCMTITWVTADDLHGSVRWGLSPDALSSTAEATTTTYSVDDMSGSPANSVTGWMDPGVINTARMTGLTPDTEFFYQVGAGTSLSSIRSFRAAATVKADTETVLFAFGDLGVTLPWTTWQEQQPPSNLTVHWIDQLMRNTGNKSTSVFHIGDISYARGWAYLWEVFGRQVEPVASRLPWMVAIGNHEYDYPGQPFHPSWSDYGTDSGGECGVPYERRFAMPGNNHNLWYSYNVGNIHILVISTEHNFLAGSPQYSFIEADLSNVDRTVTPWVIVGGHRPMYSSGDGHNIGLGFNTNNIQTHLLNTLEPLFIKQGVNLCLWGHVHKYERTCGVRNFTCASNDNDAPVHMVVGSAGNVAQDHWQNNLRKSPSTWNYHHVQPRWSVFRTADFGFSRITTNATHLHAEFIGDQRGEVHDSLWLQQP